APVARAPRPAAAGARARFVPVGDRKEQALVLRHAPRADLASAEGLVPGAAEPFPVVPAAALGDLEGSAPGATPPSPGWSRCSGAGTSTSAAWRRGGPWSRVAPGRSRRPPSAPTRW